MPTRDSATPAGAPTWLQIDTPDPQKTIDFYCALFDWTAETPDEALGGYWNFQRNGVRIAGGAPLMEASQQAVWLSYLATDDLDASLVLTEKAGGTVHVPPMEIVDKGEHLGRMAFVTDPAGGAFIGLWQAGSHPGFRTFAAHGSPGWFELHTREYDKTLDFYREVFGWQTEVISDAPEFRYSTFLTGDGLQYGGIVDDTAALPAEVPSHWQVYFATSDTGATVAKLESLGGSVTLRDPETPYGDLAVCVDNLGVPFNLVGPNEQMPMND